MMTAAEVHALGEETRSALMRPFTVVVAVDGFEPKARASLKRSKWIDYFDERHTPPGWLTALEKSRAEQTADGLSSRPPTGQKALGKSLTTMLRSRARWDRVQEFPFGVECGQ
jgi:hypothetical protein